MKFRLERSKVNPLYLYVKGDSIPEDVSVRIQVDGVEADHDAKLREEIVESIVDAVNRNYSEHLNEAPHVAVDVEAIRKACIGKLEFEVRQEAEENGWLFRVVCRNGKTVVGTADLVPNRINVVVESGVVTEIRCLG